MILNLLEQDASRVCDAVSLSPLRGKSILITGASGLLGTHYISCLRQLQLADSAKMKIYAVIASEPESYFKKLCDFSGMEIIQQDLTHPEFQNNLPEADVIIHAAGYGQPGRFMAFPIKTLHLNTSATFSLFQKLKPGGKFLFVGTSEVYVGLNAEKYSENQIGHTNTDHPRACYIEAKRCGEAICHSFRKSGVDAKIARLALAYGPGTRPGDQRVLHSLIEKGLQGRIDLLDQGLANRTYGYVSDAMELMWKMMLEGREAVYNVGGISRTSIRELALKIGELMHVPVVFPQEAHGLKDAPADVQLDLARSRAEFKKDEFVSLEEGLSRTIQWQRAITRKDPMEEEVANA